VGVNEDKLGIQVELQIGREERLWIRLQAPLEMIEMDFRMPFHSHEEEEREGGRERSWNVNTYSAVGPPTWSQIL
jgi:hypothetical protein